MAGAVSQQLEDGGHGTDRNSAIATGGDDPCPQRARRRRDRYHDFVRLRFVEHLRQILAGGCPKHAQSVLVLEPLLAGIVVDEADRAQVQPGVARQLPYHQPPAVAAADDQHVASALGDAEAPHPSLRYHVDNKAHTEQKRQREQEEQRDHARG